MSQAFALAPSPRLLSPGVEFQGEDPLVATRPRMAAALVASAIVHAVAFVALLALVRPPLERTTPPIVLPVSLVYRPGGGAGSGGAAEAPAPPIPSEPAPAAAAVSEPKPPPPIARPKPAAKPKPSPAPAETAAAPRVPGDATSGASPTQGGGGGEGARGGSGFSAASPGYGVNPLPPYPIAARQLGLEGEVLLRVFVAADGRPTTVVVLKSSGHAVLDESAAQTVRTRWRFIPATRNGVPVDDTVQVPIRFRQKEG